jgi:hypothetical protein
VRHWEWGCQWRESILGRRPTLTASIHPARSSRDRLLHSRRTQGLSQPVCAIVDCPRRVEAVRASFTNWETSIPRDRLYGSRLLTDGKKRWRGGAEGGYWARTTFIVVGTVNCGLPRGDRIIGGSVLVRHLKSDRSKINTRRFGSSH